MSRTLTIDKHEAVVDRDWLYSIGELLEKAGHEEIAAECKEIGSTYPGSEDEDEEE